MTERPASLSLIQQADLIDYLLGRCAVGGKTCAETWMLIEAGDVADLRQVSQRLRRMAPHENAIRNLVTRRD